MPPCPIESAPLAGVCTYCFGLILRDGRVNARLVVFNFHRLILVPVLSVLVV